MKTRTLLAPHARRLRERRGVALPIALLGLVLVTVLITTALLTSSTELAISSAQRDATQSLYAADAALEGFVAARAQEQISADTGVLVPGTSPFEVGGTPFNVTVARLWRGGIVPTGGGNSQVDELYSLVAEPQSGRGRSVAAQLRVTREFRAIQINLNEAAAIAADNVDVGGSAFVSGKQDASKCDSTRVVKDMTVASDTKVGRRDAENPDLTRTDLRDKNFAQGVQNGTQRSQLTKAEFAAHLLGGMTPMELAQQAKIKFGRPLIASQPWAGEDPSATDSLRRRRSSPLNWGCPAKLVSACATDDDRNYYPVIAIASEGSQVQLNNGYGQGILIILGDLRINGGFKFNGIVIVAGDIVKANGNAQIQGGLIGLKDITLDALNRDDDEEEDDLTGNYLVQYNQCAVTDAVTSAQTQQSQSARQTFGARTFNWFELVR